MIFLIGGVYVVEGIIKYYIILRNIQYTYYTPIGIILSLHLMYAVTLYVTL